MHRIANPFTAVRLRLAPPQNSRAGVAQLVERNLAKVEVASSRLVSRSTKLLQITNIGFGRCVLSDAGVAQLVERNLAKVEVASSRLVSRSKFSLSPFVCSALSGLFVFAFDLAEALLVFRSAIGIFSGPPREAFKCNSCPFQAVEKFELSPINPMSLR